MTWQQNMDVLSVPLTQGWWIYAQLKMQSVVLVLLNVVAMHCALYISYTTCR